jgi:hypothetical protein
MLLISSDEDDAESQRTKVGGRRVWSGTGKTPRR